MIQLDNPSGYLLVGRRKRRAGWLRRILREWAWRP